MSLSAEPSWSAPEPADERMLVAVEMPVPADEPAPAGHSDRCPADWRRPDGRWACVRRAGHRGRHRMRSAARVA